METFKRYQNRKKLFNKTAMNKRIQVKEKYWCNCCIQKKHLTKQFTFDVKYGRLRRGLKGGEESVEGVEGSRPPYSSVSKNNEFGQRGDFSPCCRDTRDTRTIYLVKHHLPPAFLYHPSFPILSFIHHLLHPPVPSFFSRPIPIIQYYVVFKYYVTEFSCIFIYLLLFSLYLSSLVSSLFSFPTLELEPTALVYSCSQSILIFIFLFFFSFSTDRLMLNTFVLWYILHNTFIIVKIQF